MLVHLKTFVIALPRNIKIVCIDRFSRCFWSLTWRGHAGLGMMRRAVRKQWVDAVRRCSDGVHSQLLPEGFLLTSVGKPVINSHFGDQVRAKSLSFGRGDASLKTLSSAGNEVEDVKAAPQNLSSESCVFLPVALLHQSLPLLLAGVLLPLVGLVQDLLRCRPPFETVTPHFLTQGLSANLFARLTHARAGHVELRVEKGRILAAFVWHAADRSLSGLVELCKNNEKTFKTTF